MEQQQHQDQENDVNTATTNSQATAAQMSTMTSGGSLNLNVSSGNDADDTLTDPLRTANDQDKFLLILYIEEGQSVCLITNFNLGLVYTT